MAYIPVPRVSRAALCASFVSVFLFPLLVSAQAMKVCPGGPVLKSNVALTTQGTLLLTEVVGPRSMPNYTSEWDGKPAPLWHEGPKASVLHGLLGVDLEKAPGKYDWTVSWTGADGKPESCSLTITVRAGKFPTERLTVDKQFVNPDPEQEKRAAEDQKKMKAIFDTVTPERLWDGMFLIPLKDVTTGKNFGRRRVLNGEARSPHGGVDLAAMTGTPVMASQAGKVVLAEDLYYSGGTIVIDHGFGIYTMYAHLSEIGVKPEQMVKAGEEIGKVGATGRVTGPHLHWGLTINHARVNAVLLAQHEP